MAGAPLAIITINIVVCCIPAYSEFPTSFSEIFVDAKAPAVLEGREMSDGDENRIARKMKSFTVKSQSSRQRLTKVSRRTRLVSRQAEPVCCWRRRPHWSHTNGIVSALTAVNKMSLVFVFNHFLITALLVVCMTLTHPSVCLCCESGERETEHRCMATLFTWCCRCGHGNAFAMLEEPRCRLNYLWFVRSECLSRHSTRIDKLF